MSLDGLSLIVCDDEADLRATVGEYLTRRGCTVTMVADAAALHAALDADPTVELVVLDITMPGEDGLAALRRLRRERDIAVIMLSAASDMVDRVVGLELGADDYMGKPVELRELEARIRTVLRRTRTTAREDPQPASIRAVRVGPHLLDPDSAQLRNSEGQHISLTAMEYRTLELFIENRGRVLSRDQLLQLADARGWEAFDRSIDLRVSRLRRKIEPDPAEPTIIRTVRGIGYLFDPKED